MKQQIQTIIEHALASLGVSGVAASVDVPENAGHGDYATNVAMAAFGNEKCKLKNVKWKTPLEFAAAIKEAITKDQTIANAGIVDRVEVAPPGFINIFLTEASLITEVERVLKLGETYGKASPAKRGEMSDIRYKISDKAEKTGEDAGEKAAVIGQNVGQKTTEKPHEYSRAKSAKRIMVEFADPNPFKEFHIGHLRNITLGESYCRLLETAGHDVRRVNYQGDVGMHVAKSLWGLWELKNQGVDISGAGKTADEKAKLLGRGYALGATAFEEDDKAKVEMVALNKKIYAQDAAVLNFWKEGRKWSLDYFDTVYARLGTKFERFYFESEVAPLGMQIVREHVADGVFENSDGAVIYRGEKAGLHTRVFVSKEGYATYEAKDLALAPLKYSEWPYDLSIIMTGNEQSEYFKVMLAALREISPDLAAKTRHMPFGMVNLKEGKMSSRTGNVIVAEWLIEQAKGAIYKILEQSASPLKVSPLKGEQKEKIAEKAAIAAVKYSMLKVTAISDIAFDLEASVSFEGDSGPYLQYTYARCRSVLRKADQFSVLSSQFSDKGSSVVSLSETGNLKTGKPHSDNGQQKTENRISLNPEERALARLLSQFPDVVGDAAANFAPNTLCTYLFQLAAAFNVFYAKHQILGEPPRLALTAATAQVLKNGLYLLGIETLEQM
ncbi:arginine--tRNA ligase [Candidatus Gottesmanbacteria bacterium RIFCSPLOWO2_01_FULL_48_11]|uniref:arginine--tRNA ligase n=3 Tax=Patescibacteria group TaxID=1783273 RepID=A0A1F6AS92_9BACT|nr:MAG: arginine--tRNA ligase [Candidatus Gottesmanbacteria bacterium RIFCSPLOWO2_01_FULL_48_11]